MAKLLPRVQKDRPEISESGLVDRVIQIGYNKVPAAYSWEPEHSVVRKESAREKSVMKDARVAHVMTLLAMNPSLTLEELSNQIAEYGMSMSMIEKVTVLQMQQNNLRVKLLGLVQKQKEYEEFGYGENKLEEQKEISRQIRMLESQVSQYEEEYRKVFPRQVVY
jgi:hypothetical protein